MLIFESPPFCASSQQVSPELSRELIKLSPTSRLGNHLRQLWLQEMSPNHLPREGGIDTPPRSTL
jgi:hypothetical protein